MKIKKINLKTKKKNFNRELFACIFSMSKYFSLKKKTREQNIDDVRIELKKDLQNYQLTVQKEKKIKQYNNR